METCTFLLAQKSAFSADFKVIYQLSFLTARPIKKLETNLSSGQNVIYQTVQQQKYN